MSKKSLRRTLLIACGIVSAVYAVNRDFIPDVSFKGSSLTGWHTIGQAAARPPYRDTTPPERDHG